MYQVSYIYKKVNKRNKFLNFFVWSTSSNFQKLAKNVIIKEYSPNSSRYRVVIASQLPCNSFAHFRRGTQQHRQILHTPFLLILQRA